MKINKYIKMLIIVCMLSVAVAVLFVACEPENDLLYNENRVLGRFSDGMEVLSSTPAEANAIQFAGIERVEKKFYVDNRVEGLHFTGLYLAKGEKLSVKVSESVAQKNIVVLINANFPNEERFAIDKTENKFESINGGIVDFYVNGAEAQLNSFEIVISGGVQTPYYRYGIDKFEGEETKLQNDSDNDDVLAVLDCANVRLYIPNKYVKNQKKIFNTMSWWRNAVELINEINGTSFADGVTRPILVYFGEGENSKNVVYSSPLIIEDITHYDNLLSGRAEELLEQISYQKAKGKTQLSNEKALSIYSKTVSLICNLSFVDSDKIANNEIAKFATGKENLNYALNNTLNEEEKIESLFVELLHSFGFERTADLLAIENNADEITSFNAVDYIAYKCARALKIDSRDLMQIFDFVVSSYMNARLDALVDSGEITKYYPLHTEYTFGQVSDKNRLGNITPYGRKTRFDFVENMISSKSGWEFVGLKGSDGLWTEVEKGVYDYLPSQSKLQDKFSVIFKNGDTEVKLEGVNTVDIATTKFEIFENVAFGDIDTAVKDYKKMTPTVSTSLDGAIIPKIQMEEEVNVYGLYVTSGSFRVKEKGKYKLYLKSAGLCRVDFGVPMAMSNLFYNYGLNVNEYTKELSKEVSLEANVIYTFVIYDLSIKGGAWASLGIESETETQPRDIPKDMLLHNGFKEENLFVYKEPQIEIAGYDKSSAYDTTYDGNDFVIKKTSNAEAVNTERMLDGSTDSIVAGVEGKKYDIIIHNKNKHIINQVMMSFSGIDFASGKDVFCTFSKSIDGEKFEMLNKEKLEDGKNVYQIPANPDSEYIKISFSSSKSFAINLSELVFARKFAESTIVPNTSSNIEYRGIWSREHKYLSVNGSVNQSGEKNCVATFSFYGDSFAIFATKGNGFGSAIVELDGKKYVVDFSSDSIICNSMVFSIIFDKPGRHNVKIMPNGNKNLINVDYLGYTPQVEPPVPKIDNGKLIFIIVIPSVMAVGLLIFMFIDILDKSKKRRLRFAPIKVIAAGGAENSSGSQGAIEGVATMDRVKHSKKMTIEEKHTVEEKKVAEEKHITEEKKTAEEKKTTKKKKIQNTEILVDDSLILQQLDQNKFVTFTEVEKGYKYTKTDVSEITADSEKTVKIEKGIKNAKAANGEKVTGNEKAAGNESNKKPSTSTKAVQSEKDKKLSNVTKTAGIESNKKPSISTKAVQSEKDKKPSNVTKTAEIESSKKPSNVTKTAEIESSKKPSNVTKTAEIESNKKPSTSTKAVQSEKDKKPLDNTKTAKSKTAINIKEKTTDK